jgi:beta-lactamase regulating signal transducer with metallopeptidase domain
MSDVLLIAGWCFAASVFLPLFAWALMPLLPRCAATRHLVWLALFAVLLVLPVLALVVPPQIMLSQVANTAPAAPVVAAVAHGWSLSDAVPLLILAWLAGIVFHLGRLGLGLFGLYRLCRDSVPFEESRTVRLADDGPLAFGALRPLILLPHEAAHWPARRLDAVLAHERAHLRRRDCLSQMLAQIVCAFYWPNLLLWLASRSMRREAEIAADNAVLASGIRASDYAAELLQLAEQTLRLPAMAMAAPSLEARVKSVLSSAPSRQGARAIDVFKIVWLGSAAAVALAFVRPAMAQVQEAPLAPIAPAMPQAAPAPTAALAPDAPATPAKPMHHHHHITVNVDGDRLTDADKAKIDAAVAQVQSTMVEVRPQIERVLQQVRADRVAVQVRTTMVDVQPQIERTLQQVRVDQATAQAAQQAMPQVHAAIANAMAQIEPAIHQAFADGRVDAKVNAALDRAQAQIDIAMTTAGHDKHGPHFEIHLRPPNPPMPPDPSDLNP